MHERADETLFIFKRRDVVVDVVNGLCFRVNRGKGVTTIGLPVSQLAQAASDILSGKATDQSADSVSFAAKLICR